MSYCIDEGIEDAEKRLAALRAIKAHYPKASLRDGRWYVDGPRGDITDVLRIGDDNRLIAAIKVEGMYVFVTWTDMDLVELLDKLRRDPKLYEKVVDIVARRGAFK